MENQDREITLISLPLLNSGGLGDALCIHPGLSSKECCIKGSE